MIGFGMCWKERRLNALCVAKNSSLNRRHNLGGEYIWLRKNVINKKNKHTSVLIVSRPIEMIFVMNVKYSEVRVELCGIGAILTEKN